MNRIKLTFIHILIGGFTFGQVGIGTTSPDESAALDISTMSKGVLFPKLSNTEVNSIQNPSTSLFLYNKDINSFTGFDGNQWTQDIFFPATNWDSRGNIGTLAGNYIETSNNLPFNVKTNNNLAMSINTNRQVSLNGTAINSRRLYIAPSMPNTSIPSLQASSSNGFATTPFAVTILTANLGNGSVTGTYAFSDSLLNAQNGISLGGFSYVNDTNVSGLSFYIGQPSDINDRTKEAMIVTNLKSVGIGVHEPKSRLHLDSDFYISNPSSGIIIKDSGNNCRRITVDDLGVLQVSSVISCP